MYRCSARRLAHFQTRQVTGFGFNLNWPVAASLDPAMLALVGAALVMVFVLRLPLLVVLGLSVALGIAWQLLARRFPEQGYCRNSCC